MRRLEHVDASVDLWKGFGFESVWCPTQDRERLAETEGIPGFDDHGRECLTFGGVADGLASEL